MTEYMSVYILIDFQEESDWIIINGVFLRP